MLREKKYRSFGPNKKKNWPLHTKLQENKDKWLDGWQCSAQTENVFPFLPQRSSEGFREQDITLDTHNQKILCRNNLLVLWGCRDAAVFPVTDLMKRLRCLLAFLKGLPNSHFSKWLLRDGCSYHDSSTYMFNTWLKTPWDENVRLLSTNWNWTRFFLKTNKQTNKDSLSSLLQSLPFTNMQLFRVSPLRI